MRALDYRGATQILYLSRTTTRRQSIDSLQLFMWQLFSLTIAQCAVYKKNHRATGTKTFKTATSAVWQSFIKSLTTTSLDSFMNQKMQVFFHTKILHTYYKATRVLKGQGKYEH